MSQRVILGCVVLMAVACVAATAFAWLSFRQGQEMNQALLGELKVLAKQPAMPTDLATARIRLVEGSQDGRPVAGARVSMSGNAFAEKSNMRLTESSDAEGIATFGPVRPGQYSLMISSTSGLCCRRDVILYGMRENEQLVVCPEGVQVAPSQADVKFLVDWPEDLKDEGLYVRCEFSREPSSVKVDGERWNAPSRSVELDAVGNVVLNSSDSNVRSGQKKPSLEETVRWPAARYRASEISVTRVLSAADREARVQRLEKVFGRKKGRGRFPESLIQVGMLAKYRFPDDTAPVFEARTASANEWRIPLPADVVEEARGRLTKEREALRQASTPGAAATQPVRK